MGRATARKQTGSGQGLPGWAMLTIGLIIGLFVAFLVYLDDLDQPPSASVESGDGDERSVDGDDTADADKPRFEFYSILPDLEVIVPDAPAPEDTGGEGSDADVSTEIDPEGTYFLQVGSFQKSEQADRMKAKISLLGLDVDIQRVNVSGERWHRVRIGPYSDRAKLGAAQRRLRENDIDYLVLREKASG